MAENDERWTLNTSYNIDDEAITETIESSDEALEEITGPGDKFCPKCYADLTMQRGYNRYREEKNNFQMSFKKPKGILQLPNYNGDPVEKIYNELIERNKEILEKLLSKFKQIKLVYVERYGDRISIEVSDKHMNLLVELSPDETDGISEQVSIWYKERIKNWSDDPSIMVMKQQLFILEHRLYYWFSVFLTNV